MSQDCPHSVCDKLSYTEAMHTALEKHAKNSHVKRLVLKVEHLLEKSDNRR